MCNAWNMRVNNKLKWMLNAFQLVGRLIWFSHIQRWLIWIFDFDLWLLRVICYNFYEYHLIYSKLESCNCFSKFKIFVKFSHVDIHKSCRKRFTFIALYWTHQASISVWYQTFSEFIQKPILPRKNKGKKNKIFSEVVACACYLSPQLREWLSVCYCNWVQLRNWIIQLIVH